MKKLLFFTLLIFLTFSISSFSGNGDGSSPNLAYEITNCTQLQEVNNDLESYYNLVNDINCSNTTNWNDGAGFIPLGENGTPYSSAQFDGQGFTIFDLYINNQSRNNTGLFGYATSVLVDINLENADITGNTNVGGLVGKYETGFIWGVSVNGTVTGIENVGGLVGDYKAMMNLSVSNVEVTGINLVGGLVGYNKGYVFSSISNSIVSGDDSVGGLIGKNHQLGDENIASVHDSFSFSTITGSTNVGGLVGINNGIISGSHSESYLTGANYLGGLVGRNTENSKINYSSSKGEVKGEESLGGLVGVLEDSSTVDNSYSIVAVNGTNKVGGFIGYNQGIISNSYSAGLPKGNLSLGGFCGLNEGSILNSFWDTTASSLLSSDGGIGKPMAQMKNIRNYVEGAWNPDLGTPWDFIGTPLGDEGNKDLWNLDSNETINEGYPFLSSENNSILYIFEEMVPPTHSSPSFTKNYAGKSSTFSITITDNEFLYPKGEYIFSTNNSGEWVNDTMRVFSMNKSELIEVTKSLNPNIGTLISYMWYYMDDKGNTNFSPKYSLVTEKAPSSSGGKKKVEEEPIEITCKDGEMKIYDKCIQIKKGKIKIKSKKLFDIKLKLDDSSVQTSDDLFSIITFENFGNVPTKVNLNYKITDAEGKQIYEEEGEVTVTTEEVVIKDFEELDLPEGKYTLTLTTLYNENVADEFTQKFSIGKTPFFKSWKGYLLIFLIMLMVVYLSAKYSPKLKKAFRTPEEKELDKKQDVEGY